MNRSTSVLAATAVALATVLAVLPAFAATGSGLTMNVAFNPNPPRQGKETITITLQDTHNKPVSNANVIISTSMRPMSMGGPTIKATHSRAGLYVAKLNLNFGTQWTFDVKATAGHKSVRRSLTENVK